MLSLALAAEPAAAPASVAPAQAQPAAAETAAPVAVRLRAVLDEMEASQKDDFVKAALLVLAETNQPSAFYPLMEEASKAGSAAATVWLVPQLLNRLSAQGASLETDARAVDLRARLLAAVEKGYQPAMVRLSHLAVMGIGGEKDEALAKRCLVEGSKVGNLAARAAYLMFSERLKKGPADPAVEAELKRNNFYVEELFAQILGDTADGIAWLRKATAHGSAVAPYLLTQSRAAALPDAESLEMLKLAAERHHEEAVFLLGSVRLQAKALGGAFAQEADARSGLDLMRLAATLGHPEAAQALATALAQGAEGAANAAQVCALYRMAAEQGEPHGMAGYGYCLLSGLGCTVDAALGESLLLKGIEKGAQWGNQALASACYNGFGVKQDLRRAVNALGEDAAMGSLHAYAIMAAITALGNESTAPDATRARIYLDMAKAGGDTSAQAIYEAILATRGWRFFPLLWQ